MFHLMQVSLPRTLIVPNHDSRESPKQESERRASYMGCPGGLSSLFLCVCVCARLNDATARLTTEALRGYQSSAHLFQALQTVLLAASFPLKATCRSNRGPCVARRFLTKDRENDSNGRCHP